MKIKRLSKAEVADFWHLRLNLFEELGEVKATDKITDLEMATQNYYLKHINQDLYCWGAFDDNKLISIGAICLFNRVPYLENLSGMEAYILSIYTLPDYRKQGLATKILHEIETFAKQKKIKRLWLNSSENGRKLYLKEGFVLQDNEMELIL